MSHALVPQALSHAKINVRPWAAVGAWAVGILGLAALARVVIPLPWTPVPITGQTFGVALLGLLGGRKLAPAAVAGYLALGAAGAPVFAGGDVRMATLGYLAGMLVASYVVGRLADLGWSNTFGRALAAAYVGSACTFALGLFWLSRFLPADALLAAGLWPFMIGDLVKNVVAAAIAAASADRA